MSTQSSFVTWLRHPGSIVLIITVVLMFVVLSEQSRQSPDGATVTSDAGASAKMGNELPHIVRQFSTPVVPINAGSPDRLQAPDLSSLLVRLESKVKAEPANISNRLLLAQTYNELGLGGKALQEARAARKQDLAHARAKLVLASILSRRENKDGLNEAKKLLEDLQSSSEIKQYLVAMYLGDAFIRMGDHVAALNYWKQAVDDMPVSDNRRPDIEKRIADLSIKAP